MFLPLDFDSISGEGSPQNLDDVADGKSSLAEIHSRLAPDVPNSPISSLGIRSSRYSAAVLASVLKGVSRQLAWFLVLSRVGRRMT